jgi:hypothetical protein
MVLDITYLNERVEMRDFGVYRRRDQPFTLSGKHGGCYGEKGHRMYDYAREQVTT